MSGPRGRRGYSLVWSELYLVTVSSAPCSHTVWRNRRARVRGCLFGLTGFLLPLFLFASILFGAFPRDLWLSLLGVSGVETLEIYLVRIIPASNRLWISPLFKISTCCQ